MFTGIIQKLGRLAAKQTVGGTMRLVIETVPWDPPLAEGESVAVNGVCLTAARITAHGFHCDALRETLKCSNLGAKAAGDSLNLERALRAGQPLGGHIVSGHVEGLGTLTGRAAAGSECTLQFRCDKSLLRQMIPKGSVACDGISLTIASLTDTAFAVNIIPYTLEHTSLGKLKTGDTVNLETDLIGKYVLQWLGQQKGHETGRHGRDEMPPVKITEETLRKAGFTE